MNHPSQRPFLAALLVFATSAGLLVASKPVVAMSKLDYSTAQDGIRAKSAADKLTCGNLSGNARDICMQDARGKERVAKAELEQIHSPSPQNAHALRIAQADAVYAVARERCFDKAGSARVDCRKDALSALAAASADATGVAKPGATKAATRIDKTEAKQADAKRPCEELIGDGKTACLLAAKTPPARP